MDDGAVAGPSTGGNDEKEQQHQEINPQPSVEEELSDAAQRVAAKTKKKGAKKKEPPEEENKSGSDERRKCRLGLIIGHQIGSGSFAKVYKAYSCQRQKDVAVKIFKRHDIPENYFNKFIVREIEVIKELRHRNLVKFYDCQFTTKR